MTQVVLNDRNDNITFLHVYYAPFFLGSSNILLGVNFFIASLPARLLGDKSRVKSCWGAGSSVSTTSTISEDVDGSRG